ncbi:MAG: hypothetical protein ACI85O_003825 [Saprospiraceae bacterium]|jgi:hypothetical protein
MDKFEKEVFSKVFFKKSLHSRSYGTIFWRKIAEKYDKFIEQKKVVDKIFKGRT